MNDAFRPRTAIASQWDATWTATPASVVVAVFLAFLPTTEGPAVPDEVTHPVTCRACVASTPEARAVRDASLIANGAIEGPAGSAGFSD